MDVKNEMQKWISSISDLMEEKTEKVLSALEKNPDLLRDPTIQSYLDDIAYQLDRIAENLDGPR